MKTFYTHEHANLRGGLHTLSDSALDGIEEARGRIDLLARQRPTWRPSVLLNPFGENGPRIHVYAAIDDTVVAELGYAEQEWWEPLYAGDVRDMPEPYFTREFIAGFVGEVSYIPHIRDVDEKHIHALGAQTAARIQQYRGERLDLGQDESVRLERVLGVIRMYQAGEVSLSDFRRVLQRSPTGY